MKKQGKLSLVGAGPGDPELISLKGLRALQQGGAILYDALVHPSLLEHAPAEAPRVYVGKRASRHRFSQTEINQMCVAYALEHGHVVRLKGGDPFVFGRGHEELTYARLFELEVEVIPGVSSAISLSGMQGVPLTRRGMSESFWVLTGTTRSGSLSRDLPLAAQSDATAVILMGMRKLGAICALYRRLGKGGLPVMVIQHGSLPQEQVALGTVDTIEAEVVRRGLGTPAIIVIGEVVHLHPHMAYEFARQEAAKPAAPRVVEPAMVESSMTAS